jgi:site-specific DNA-adenine methylase/N6-adenosine-specific RNA methylase IME4
MEKYSPITLMGGKAYIVNKIVSLLPESFDYFIEPCCGTAEISLGLIADGFIDGSKVWINDINFALIAFFKTLRDHPNELRRALMDVYKNHLFGDETLYQTACDFIEHPSDDTLEMAKHFYIMNMLVYAGKKPKKRKTKPGWSNYANPWKSGKGLTPSRINALMETSRLLKGVKITCLDFSKIVPPTKNTLILCDPIYKDDPKVEIDYYGVAFDHDRFAVWCNGLRPKCQMLITYNNHPDHLRSFSRWKILAYDVFYNTANVWKGEFVITNYDIPFKDMLGDWWNDVDMPPPLPDEKYEIVYADCPWSYYGDENKMGAACKHYQLMDVEDIKAMDVQSITADKSVCLLWATSPRLPEAMEVMKSWGFTYNNVIFQWHKTTKDGKVMSLNGVKPTYTKVGNTEYLLVGSTEPGGRSPWKGVSSIGAGMPQVVKAPRLEHSRKPDVFRELIVELLGDRKRIELFARRAADDWDVWGKDAA